MSDANKVDIRALAALSRLEVSDAEIGHLEKDIASILSFVEQVQKAPTPSLGAVPGVRNVMRDDVNPHESGLYTEDVLRAAPKVIENRVVVKQVISKKKS